jgi:nucleotide-binding universal stress UspA family protein
MPRIQKTVRLTGLFGKVTARPVDGKRVAAALIQAGADDDLIVPGAIREGVFSSVLFGEIPEKVARYSHILVMIIRRYEGTGKSVAPKGMG